MHFRKLAIIMPTCYGGGMLRGLKATSRMMALGAQALGHDLKVVVGVPRNSYDIAEVFSDVISCKNGIEIREFDWSIIPQSDCQELIKSGAFPYHKERHSPLLMDYVLPDDGASSFCDCDFWLIFVDRLPRPLIALRPYGVYVHDLIQRYAPDDFGAFYSGGWLGASNVHIPLYRGAEFVVGTTPSTLEDLTSFYGVRGKKILLPQYFTPLDLVPQPIDHPCRSTKYILWITNSSPHKNHLNGLRALDLYYEEFDGKLDVLVCGWDTHLFSPDCRERHGSYFEQVRQFVKESSRLSKNVHFLGYVSDREYVYLLNDCAFIYHNVLADNGTFSIVEAMMAGKASVASDYPQLHYMVDVFKTPTILFDPYDPVGTAQGLKKMETGYEKMTRLSSSAQEFALENIAPQFASHVIEAVEGIEYE